MNVIGKFKAYAQTRPNRARVIAIGAVIIGILLISSLIAVILRDDLPKNQLISASDQVVVKVSITKDGFVPADLQVKKGTKIIWTNADEAIHQIQANPHPTGDSLPGLKSEILNNQQVYEYTADTAGSFSYHDHINPETNGKIEIQEK